MPNLRPSRLRSTTPFPLDAVLEVSCSLETDGLATRSEMLTVQALQNDLRDDCIGLLHF